MQPHPREVAAEILQAVEILRQEVEERADELVMRDAFQIDLHSHVRERAEGQRHSQALAPHLLDDPAAFLRQRTNAESLGEIC